MSTSSAAGERGLPARYPLDLGRLLRLTITALWFGYTAIFVVFGGITFDRRVIAVWMMVTVVLLSWRGSAREARRTLLSWLPFVGFILAYEISWGIADQLGRPVAVTPQITLERGLFGWAFGGEVPTTTLQRHLAAPGDPRLLDVVVSIVYVSHYFVPYVLAGVLWARRRSLWRPYAMAFSALGVLSCTFWALFPTAPPWMAGEQGLLPETPRLALQGWDALNLRTIALLVGSGQKSVNLVAAIPSLHGAHCLLVVIFVWRFVPRVLRPILALYPVAMCFTLVYGGEHYIIDVLLGWAMVAILVPTAYRIDRWMRRRAALSPVEVVHV